MGLLKIIAAVVDTRELVLYDVNGNKHIIPQGDPRVREIIEKVLPIVEVGDIAEINLTEINAYADFQERSGGLVKFFRVAKNKLKELFGAKEERAEAVFPDSFGQVPAGRAYGVYERTGNVEAPTLPNKLDAVAEIMNHAQSISSNKVMDDETFVAIVDNKVITGVEDLKNHINHSNLHGSQIGMQNLLRRLGNIAEIRQHNVEDVIRFMKRGDLPVADDGTIIAYKRLFEIQPGVFADPRTKKVRQKIGSFVCMDEKLVDRERTTQCSNGLHIARRHYLKNFKGDVCVLVKIRPEDVIAVPHNEPDKIRVCGYHILSRLDQDSFEKVCDDKPMTNELAKEQLSKAIAGKHVGILEEVRITGPMGTGVIITPKNGTKEPKVPISVPNAEAIPDTDTGLIAPVVSPKEVNETVAKIEEVNAIMNSTGSRKEKARGLITQMYQAPGLPAQCQAAQALRMLKRKSKVSYDVLGLSHADQTVMGKLLATLDPPVKVSKATKALSQAMKKS